MAKAFYQSVHYEALRERKVRRGPPGPNIGLSAADPVARHALLDHFEEMSVERVGVLRGEYLLHYSGLLLADRSGALTYANLSLEDYRFAQYLANEAARPETNVRMKAMIDAWEQWPVVVGAPVLCDPYSKNYYHFSLEMIPRLRYFDRADEAPVIMTSDSLARPFQRDLATRTLAARRVVPLQGGARVRDPVLAHDSLSEEGVLWLREAAGLLARPGGRRLYIRRNATGTRATPGGGLSESAGLCALLRDFGFETVDFGNGGQSVAAQVAMLDGAGLVLSAHGAALTNLAYLDRGAKVIEVFGERTRNACFMHLAAIVGFEYRALFSSAYDDGLDMVVDLDELREVLSALA